MGTHLRVLRESYPMSTNMTGFRWFFQNLCVLALWPKVALALEGLTINAIFKILSDPYGCFGPISVNAKQNISLPECTI